MFVHQNGTFEWTVHKMYNCTFYGILISDHCVKKFCCQVDGIAERFEQWTKWNYENTCHWKPGQDRHDAHEQNAKREVEKPGTKNDKDLKEKFTKSKYLRRADIEIGRPEENMWLTTGDPGCWLKCTSLSSNFFIFSILILSLLLFVYWFIFFYRRPQLLTQVHYSLSGTFLIFSLFFHNNSNFCYNCCLINNLFSFTRDSREGVKIIKMEI